MNKKKLFTILLAMFSLYATIAQRGATVSSATFKTLVGTWHGTLFYSGTIIRKPYTTTATLVVKQINRTNKFEFLHIYSKDPKENVADTITISNGGKKLNQETIKSKRSIKAGDVEVITEAPGFDNDNNKAAIIKQTYTIGKHIYIYKKQVQLEGQTDWLDRQEFTYKRTGK